MGHDCKTILVVEDDAIIREGLRAVLEREGYTLVLTANATEGLTYLNLQPAPDVILLDMMMPMVDGWGFLGQFRHHGEWSSIPIIIMTAMGMASEQWARSLGAAALLKKPFETDALVWMVKHFC